MTLLNPQDTSLAAERGWELGEVYDLDMKAWIIEILPTPANPIKSARMAQLAVTARARTGDALSIRAIQVVLNGFKPAPAAKKAKKK